jgi:hypothetical protein
MFESAIAGERRRAGCGGDSQRVCYAALAMTARQQSSRAEAFPESAAPPPAFEEE